MRAVPLVVRRVAGFVASSVVAGVAVVLPSSPAPAAEGPAPAPRSLTVIADVHTDAVATFLDGGELVLGTLADLPEPGTRYVPEEVWFHVDDDSLTTLPDGFGFIGEAGSPVWIAPMANPGPTQLWPGFSTDSVPLGAIDGDQTTFALVGVEGPGDVEVYTNDGLGGVDRLWSSDEAFGSFTVGQAHLHANWAFTAPGTYELVVAASATIDGAPVGDTATYTFVVGPLAGPVATQTYLQNDGADVVTAGTPVELFASVLPLVGGYVEFRSGSTVLGHQEVSEWGEAPFVTDALPVGPHSITASFVPEVANVANGSTSAPVEVTVTSPSGVEFAVVGVEGPYLPGDTLSVQAVGLTLGSDQWFRWQWRAIGTADFDLGDPTSDPTYTRDLSASDHGYEVAVGVWQCEEWDSYCNYEPTLIARSAWVPVTVLGIGDPIVAELLTSDHAHLGDEAAIAVSGRELGEGEVLEVVRRDGRYGSTWWNDELFVQDGGVVHLYLTGGGEFAVRVLSDGLVVAQSEPFSITVDPYEVQIAGVQGVYRPGATLHAQAIVYPESPDLYYEWSYFVPGGLPYEMVEEGYGPEAATTEIPDLTLAHDGAVFFLVASVPLGPPFVEEPGLMSVGQTNLRVYVQDIDPSVQIFQFQPLGGHYHQGNDVNLVLGADPPLADGDEVVWEWQWPGTDWAPFPGASGLGHRLTAEQALDGVQVRATLVYADPEAEPKVAGPVTIYHDDHGAAPWQEPTVAGETSVTDGDTVTLTRSLPSKGTTVLIGHRWERLAPAGGGWSVIAGESGPTLSFPATLADDGAQYRVSIIEPNGDLAYGPSPAVTLAVAEGSSEPPPPPPPPSSQTIVAKLDESHGVLSISVDPDDRTVVLPPFALSDDGSRWETASELRPTTVIDTRGAQVGWVASAQLADLVSSSGALGAGHVGWAPVVTSTGPGQIAAPGDPVAALLDGGPGLAVSRVLATGAPGASRGTARLGAGLVVAAPTTLHPGTYAGILTLTVT